MVVVVVVVVVVFVILIFKGFKVVGSVNETDSGGMEIVVKRGTIGGKFTVTSGFGTQHFSVVVSGGVVVGGGVVVAVVVEVVVEVVVVVVVEVEGGGVVLDVGGGVVLEVGGGVVSVGGGVVSVGGVVLEVVVVDIIEDKFMKFTFQITLKYNLNHQLLCKKYSYRDYPMKLKKLFY